jgi:Tfp pilus assembly protein PilN
LARSGPKTSSDVPEAEPGLDTSPATETSPATADDPAQPAGTPVDHGRSAASSPAAKAPRGRARAAFGALLRVTLLLAIVVGVGAGLYVGWPVVYERYIAPIQANSTDLDAMRGRLAELQHQVDAIAADQSAMQAGVTAIDDRLAEHDRRLSALDALTETLASNDTAAMAETSRQVRLLKAMELMSRARLFLYQANYGLAVQDIRTARDLLLVLGQDNPALEGASIAIAADALTRALSALPDFPIAASADLDIAWQAMLGEVPTPEASPAGPAQSDSSSPTAEPSAQ